MPGPEAIAARALCVCMCGGGGGGGAGAGVMLITQGIGGLLRVSYCMRGWKPAAVVIAPVQSRRGFKR